MAIVTRDLVRLLLEHAGIDVTRNHAQLRQN
jgi:hypothetical protein